MQKIHIRISGLSPHSIDLLADSLLRLSSSLDEDTLFELQNEPGGDILLPGSPRSGSLSDSPPGLLSGSPGVSLGSSSLSVFCHDLLYLVSDRHYVIFHTKTMQHRIRIRFQDAALLVPPDLFLKAGRGVLLNMEHILRIQKNDCIMSDGARFSLSRQSRREKIRTFQSFQRRRHGSSTADTPL